jgi:uncharacterized protein YybS (DUF2232 family)
MAKDILNGIAITGFLVALSIFIPVLGFFFTLLVPLPTFFFRAKLGRRVGAFIPIVVTFMTILVTGGFSIDIFILIELFILGFVLGELIEIKLSIEKTMLFCSAAVWLTAMAALLFYGSLAQDTTIEVISRYVGKNLDYTLSLYKDMGMPEETLQMIDRSMERITYVMVRIIPAFVAASTLLIIWLNLLMAKPLFFKKGLLFPDFGRLSQWKSPEMLIWAAVGTGVMLLLPGVAMKVMGINGLLVLSVIYFFQGIAIAAFFFEKKKLPRMLRVFLYSLIGFQQIVLLFVIGMGFFDVWLDIRKLNKIETA